MIKKRKKLQSYFDDYDIDEIDHGYSDGEKKIETCCPGAGSGKPVSIIYFAFVTVEYHH